MPASDAAGDGEGHPEGEEGAGDVEGAGGGDEAKVDQRTKCHNWQLILYSIFILRVSINARADITFYRVGRLVVIIVMLYREYCIQKSVEDHFFPTYSLCYCISKLLTLKVGVSPPFLHYVFDYFDICMGILCPFPKA